MKTNKLIANNYPTGSINRLEITPLEIAKLANDLILALELGELPTPASTAWILAGLHSLLDGKDIRLALGLKQRQGIRAESGIKLANRDEAIRTLALQIPQPTASYIASILNGDRSDRHGLDSLVMTIKDAGPISKRQISRVLAESNQAEPPSPDLWQWCR